MANSKKPNNDAPVNPIQSASSPANQQVHSKIMHLPQEIRDEIYANVFCSIHFIHAFYDERHRAESSTAEVGLALLRTCQRMRDEIGLSWLHHVLFSFLNLYALLEKLAIIPITLREQIRHVCVHRSRLIVFHDEENDPESSYNTAGALKMLPGLKLDTLTVIGTGASSHRLEAFYNIESLIRHSDGWKELHYLSDSPESLAYKVDVADADSPWDPNYEYSPRPQPSDWQNALDQRDGEASHPSVIVYQATATAAPGADMPVLHPCIPEPHH
jgi:hypothetical protein